MPAGRIARACHGGALRRLAAAVVVVVAALGAVGCAPGSSDPAGRPADAPRPAAAQVGPPNLVLITLESVRADHVHHAGYPRATTPALDALAEEGRWFANAYAPASWTLPSHATLFTGLYPSAHGVVSAESRLADGFETLAETLRDAGYQTAGIISGPFLQRAFHLDQGFEIYDESASNPAGNQAAHADVTNPRVQARLDRFFREDRDPSRPFFLFLYLWDPHYDYIPPPPYDRAFVPPDAEVVDLRGYETNPAIGPHLNDRQVAYIVSQYDGEILWTDRLLEHLWRTLRGAGLWERTAILVTADHGEEFFEHGGKGHRRTLYEECIHVPLVLKAPEPAPKGRDDRLAGLVDVRPTLLELAEVADPVAGHGRSLLAPAGGEPRTLFFELVSEWNVRDPKTGERGVYRDFWLAARRGPFKFVIERNERRRQFFHLGEDPGETRDAGAQYPEALAELDRALTRHVAAMAEARSRLGEAPPVSLTPEQRERLRALGYLD